MALRRAEPKHYAAGAAISNGIVWSLLMSMLTIKNIIPLNILTVTHVFSCSLSSIIAGYLTARRSSEDHIKVGFTTGLVSSLLYTGITRIVFGTFETSTFVWIGFLFGGMAGGAYRRIKIERMELSRS